MKLDVIETGKPWFADGLTFTCQQCGNCCTGGPGYVWVSDEELDRMAAYLKIAKEAVVDRYCRRIGERVSLKERRSPQGLYDCVFLRDVKLKNGNVKRVCSVYDVRPLQCRTWPFWDGVLASRENWDSASKRCHGINHGARRFSLAQITSLRDATDWPANPPTSRQASPPPAPPAHSTTKPAARKPPAAPIPGPTAPPVRGARASATAAKPKPTPSPRSAPKTPHS